MSKFQRVLVILFLCIVVILISGILVPKYLSTGILELRQELNSQNSNSKYNSHANLVPVSEKFVQNASGISSRSVKTTEISVLANNSIQSLRKIKRRKKRQVVSNDEYFTWNFNFNLTGQRNHALQEMSSIPSDSSRNDKHLNIAVYAGGEAKKETAFSEIQQNMRSVEHYFKYLLENSENLTNEEAKNELALLKIDFTDAEGNRNESLLRGREGKFFSLGSLNIFGFLNSRDKSVSSSTALPDLETEKAIVKEELARFTESVQTDSFTENSLGIPNFQAQSLVSESLSLEHNKSSNLPGKTEDGDCVDCDAVGLDSTITSNPESQIKLSETVTRSTEFTDEFLKMFCMSLVKNVEVSQHLSEDESTEPEQNTDLALKSLENGDFDFQPSSATEKNSQTFKENILSSGTMESEDEIRQRIFFNLNGIFGIGSGRAADEGSNDLTSEEFADVDLTHLPTLLDCKNLFKMGSSESLGNFGVTKSVSDERSLEIDRSTLGELPKVLLQTEQNDLNRNAKILFTSTDVNEVQPTTEFPRDGRFLSIFGFGSGNGESRSLGTDAFGSDIKEVLGSGDIRSLRNQDFDTDKSELGSGDIRSLRNQDFDIDKSELGSGDIRSLRDEDFDTDKSEFGSGDLRLLGITVSDIIENEFGRDDLGSLGTTVSDFDKNEKFGSGNSRSFWSALFGTEMNEIGSGDFRSLEATSFGIDDFGSGDMRSLEIGAFGNDRNEFGNGDSFKVTVSDSYDDQSTISSNKQRFLGLLGLAGSGDGRELSENVEVSRIEKCINCSMEATEQPYDCEDYGCNYGNFNESDINVFEDHELNASSCGKCFDVAIDNSETLNKSGSISSDGHRLDCRDCNKENVEMNSTIVKNESFSVCDECKSSVLNTSEFGPILPTEEMVGSNTKQERGDENLETSSNTKSADVNDRTEKLNFSGTENVIKSPHEKTTENTQRFLRPIFLTGSGDGGLFGDSGGPINLVEEDEMSTDKDNHIDKDTDSKAQNEITSPVQSTENIQRFSIFPTGSGDGGLFENSGAPINLVEKESNISKSRNSSLRHARLDDDQFNSESNNGSTVKQSNENLVDISANEKFTSPVTFIRRRGRVEDSTADFMESFKNKSLNANKNNSNIEKRTETPSVKSITVTVPSNVIQRDSFCTAARDCNSSLNERCITVNSLRVCDCSKGYVRSKINNKCIVKKIVETSIKLPAEDFDEDLKIPFSPKFQQKRKSAIETLMLLLQKDPELLQILSEMDVVKFSPGSLVITLNLVFATENKSEAQLVQHVEDDLQQALRDESLMRSVSLDVSEASLVAVNGEIDYCKSSELNYCSENAYCVSNAALPGMYTCHCKEHYRDESFDPRRIGETCLAKCPEEYCGPYGHCDFLANDEKICLCTGLYFGRRCEVPGLYVLIVLGCVVFISLTMLLLLVFKRRCSKFSYRDSEVRETEENTRIQSHVNGKVYDSIALEENVGTRFANISTPMPHPAIKITRPTVTGSGQSDYDYDSTFDSTPSGNGAEGDSAV